VLLVLLSLTNLPLPWSSIFPEAQEPPAFILYLTIVLAIVGFVAATGLWPLQWWSVGATVVIGELNVVLAVLGAAAAVQVLTYRSGDSTEVSRHLRCRRLAVGCSSTG
jgi:hypothetical protein